MFNEKITNILTVVDSAVSAQLWAPQINGPPLMVIITMDPLMVIIKKRLRLYATSRGQMAFKTKYSNCRHNFGRTRPVARC